MLRSFYIMKNKFICRILNGEVYNIAYSALNTLLPILYRVRKKSRSQNMTI